MKKSLFINVLCMAIGGLFFTTADAANMHKKSLQPWQQRPALLEQVQKKHLQRKLRRDFKANSCSSSSSKECKLPKRLTYYLFIDDFVNSFIEIPTSNVSGDSTTIASSYLAGRASIYNEFNEQAGTCSASFLNMQTEDGIFTDISNYLSVDNGLIVSWLTPTTLINLELDSIINSMVTECIVKASTKIGVNPFYGKTFNMIVSSDDEKIYFQLTKI